MSCWEVENGNFWGNVIRQILDLLKLLAAFNDLTNYNFEFFFHY